MAYLLLLSIFWGLCCAIVGVVYAVVLAGEDTPADGWFRLLDRARDAGGWRSWVASPLGGCAKCFSGQLALWSSSIFIPWSFWAPSIAAHLVAACSAVLFATVISHGYQWLKNQI
jgi:hypothetical protein